MVKEKSFDANTNWYEVWMKQSKEFFETADKQLKTIFAQGTASANPEDHMQQIHQWQEMLKAQFNRAEMGDQQKAYENYWKMMAKLCSEASDKMVEEWLRRSREHKPIKNIHELYELWLSCCQESYEKYLHTKAYQEAYGEFMNAALKFWKSSIPKG